MWTLVFLSCFAIGISIGDDPVRSIDVTIVDKEKHITADKKYDVECRTTGFKSNVTITWWKGGHQVRKIPDSDYRQFYSEIVTWSILAFLPSIEDNGKYLICRVENVTRSGSAIEVKWQLNVHFVPIVWLRMKSGVWYSMNVNDIRERDDVYFKCDVHANPEPHQLIWFYKDKIILHDEEEGVILSNYSLTLKNVSRWETGYYTCHAANTEGNGTSNLAFLTVKFAPACKKRRAEMFGVEMHDTVHLKCEFDANPPVTVIDWLFLPMGSDKDFKDLRPFMSTREAVTYLNYTPASGFGYGYGSLGCYGFNEEYNVMRRPCIYDILPRGRPYPICECTVYGSPNSTYLQFDCPENFDGGLPQTHFIEFIEPDRGLEYNVTVRNCSAPIFYVCCFEPGPVYFFNLYAVNAEGRSDPLRLKAANFDGVIKYDYVDNPSNGTEEESIRDTKRRKRDVGTIEL